MDYKKDKRIKRKRIIAPQPTNTDKMPLRIGLKRYKPTKAHTNPIPHVDTLNSTKAIFKTNFMLIGK